MARVDSLYELLEISSSASVEEIEASYQRIMGFLGPDSMAMYSMLEDGEADRLREQLDEAYHTLTDPERRAAYDRTRDSSGAYPSIMVPQQAASDPNLTVGLMRRDTGGLRRDDERRRDDMRRRDEEVEREERREARREELEREERREARREELERKERRESDSDRDTRDTGRRAARGDDRVRPSDAMVHAAALEALDDISEGAALMPPPPPAVVSSRSVAPVDGKRRRRLQPRAVFEVGPDTEFSGSLLRRLRESADATLEDLAEITKISKRYLTALEENDFDTLPAFVYVRGFVSEYARALGLDSKLVSNSYMSLYRRYRGESG